MPRKSRIIPSNPNGESRYDDWVESSVDTPGFRTLKERAAEGLVDIPIQPYTFQSFTGTATPGKDPGGWYPPYYLLYNGCTANLLEICDGQAFVQAGNGLCRVDRDEVTHLIERLQTQLRAEVQAKVVNLPVCLLELGKTFTMFRDIGDRLRSGMSALVGDARNRPNPTAAINLLLRGSNRPSSRGRPPSRAESLATLGDGLTSRWLEWSFGIKPVLSDLGALAQRAESNFFDKRKKTLFWNVKDRVWVNTSGGDPTAYNGRSASISAKIDGAAMCCAEVNNPVARALSDYGIDDPLSWGWELLPFSFVVDWFAPVGDWLSGLRPIHGLAFRYGFITLKGQGLSFQTMRIQWGSSSVGRLDFLSKRRIPLSNFPEPTWRGYDPNGYGPRQVAHTMALVWQLARTTR